MTTTTTTTCRYCHQPVEDSYDPEPPGSFYNTGYHFGCRDETPDGPWYVRTVQNAATPPRVHVQRYGSQLRAREVAAELRQWNQRDWPCGAQLDIFVGHDDTEGTAR